MIEDPRLSNIIIIIIIIIIIVIIIITATTIIIAVTARGIASAEPCGIHGVSLQAAQAQAGLHRAHHAACFVFTDT